MDLLTHTVVTHRLFLALVFCLWSSGALPVIGQSFNDAAYTKHTWKSFQALPQLQATIDFDHPDYALLNAAVFFMTNKARQAHGRQPFRFSPKLRDMADFHSSQMAEYEFMAHTNPHSPRYATMVKRSERFQVMALAENVASTFLYKYKSGSRYYKVWEGNAYSFFTHNNEQIPKHSYLSFAASIVKGWMNSKGHRAAILNRRYTSLGCAIKWESSHFAIDKIPLAYGTQNFGQ